MFFGDVEIGTPKQRFSVIFDSGSNPLWVPGAKCPDQCCQNHKKFEQHKSSTFKPTGQKTDLYYGTGAVRLDYGVDKVSLGDVEVDWQPFGMTQEVKNTLKVPLQEKFQGGFPFKTTA